jgi:DNA-binding Lrp family transcriptional regulator
MLFLRWFEMTFGEYLKNKYGMNEPIYTNEIQFGNYSRPWIYKELKKLVDSGEIKRFDIGIYFFAKKMSYGVSGLDARKVVERRFLSDGNDIYGYIAGSSLLNQTGLSTQVPKLVELVTNNESTRVRNINIGKQLVRARRSRTTITKENANTLQFLELMNLITPSGMDKTERFMLRKYIKASGITRNLVLRYAEYFPAKAMKNMVESGAAYELA